MSDDHWRLMRLVFSAYQTQVVSVFVTMDLADHLAAAPLTVAELAGAAGCHEPTLRRVLRAATGLRLVDETGDGRFELTSIGRRLCSDGDGSVKNLVEMLVGPGMWQAAGGLDHTLRTGEPAFEHVFGKPGYEWLAEHPEHVAVFYSAVIEAARVEAPPVAKVCDLSDARDVVDVGGGNGSGGAASPMCVVR